MWKQDYLDKMPNKEHPQNVTLTCTTKPTASITTVAEAKNYFKISHDVDNDLIELILKNANHIIENIIHKSIVKASYKQQQSGGTNNIKLLKVPIIGNPTVTYYEFFDTTTGTILTINTDYRIVGNILHNANYYFSKGRDGDGYTIEYDSGLFESATDDNSMEYSVIKNCMLRLSSFFYENRQQYCTNFNEENWSISYNMTDIPIEIKNALMPLRQSNLGVL